VTAQRAVPAIAGNNRSGGPGYRLLQRLDIPRSRNKLMGILNGLISSNTKIAAI
jgi:hypothetical protein